MSKIILDTNAYSFLFKGDTKVERELNTATSVHISIIVIGELLKAFKKGEFEKKNRQLLEKFLDKPVVSIIDVHWETAEIYADLTYVLEKKGKPIPINDLWIAAHAIETGSKLITYDKHFLKIPGLRIWDYLRGE